jgi:IMP dehydrogenase/GMP reductase
MNDLKFDLNDIVIVPAKSSDINSRRECIVYNCFNNADVLPLMASPMDTVVSPNNYKSFIRQGIIPCLPRTINPENVPIEKNRYFQSFGLCDIESQLKLNFDRKYDDNISDIEFAFYNYPNVLIDIANAHMSKLISIIKEIKKRWPDINLMVGNVANPETFANLGKAGADYIRISIGTGAGCTTAANVSINYPMGSLISECRKQKIQLGLWNTYIVADGGMKNYSDVIKSLGLGADYVMMGSTFNKAIESAGFNYLYGIKISPKTAETLWRWGFPVKKKYRGMSTKAVQRNWGRSQLVTAEGITKYQNVEYTLEQWTENFKDYLRSAMSYCGAKRLDNFIGNVQYVFITDAARRRFDK